MTVGIISHRDCELHDAGPGHPEKPDRVKVINKAIKAHRFPVPVKFFRAPLAREAQLKKVHDASYIDWIYSIAPPDTTILIDEDTCMDPHTLTAARRAAGAVIKAVDLVMHDEVNVVFCNVRPPGHHAEIDKAMGFCFFNNIAVGVKYALDHYQLQRIAIIDFDVHRGNGTQTIFQNDNRILYCSSFQHPLYPGYEEESDNEHILSVPIDANADAVAFRQAVEGAWFEKLAEFRPQLIFFSAGFDAHTDDPMANLNLQKDDYVWLTKHIANIAKVHAEGRMISVLEGGYNLEALAECVPAHIEAMI
jgi:acetoin utilization deacetylase AcuC-like enzyme